MIPRTAESHYLRWRYRGKILLILGGWGVGKTTLLQRMFSENDETLFLRTADRKVRTLLESGDPAALQQLFGAARVVIIDDLQRIHRQEQVLGVLSDQFKDVQVVAAGSMAPLIAETDKAKFVICSLLPLSLSEMYKGESEQIICRQLPFHMVFGSYPEVCSDRSNAAQWLFHYTEQYLLKDMLGRTEIRKPDLLNKLLYMLAIQIGNEISFHDMAKQLGIKSETVSAYVELLERAFVIFRLTSFQTDSRKEAGKMNKFYFIDNGVRNAVIGNFEPLNVRMDQEMLWENFVMSERRKRNALINSDRTGYFWRNYNQSTVDYLEVQRDQMTAFAISWQKEGKVTKAFTNMYPQASTELITPDNFVRFCNLA